MSPCGGFGRGELPSKILKIEVLGNGISNILRSSQRVIMSQFSNFPLDPHY